MRGEVKSEDLRGTPFMDGPLRHVQYTSKCHVPDKCKKEKVTFCEY